jgi:hypothetical protein
MKTYETDGPNGIYVMYLCNEIPSADVKHDQGRTYVTIPDEDDKALRDYFEDRGYTYSIFRC